MSVMEQEPRRARRSFTDEFKADAVALVLDEDRKIVDMSPTISGSVRARWGTGCARWVTARKAEGFPITMACRVAAVSRQAYTDWRARQAAGPTDAEVDEARLVNAMVDIADDFDGTYGSPRMTVELANRGWSVNHKRVERLLADNRIVGSTSRPRSGPPSPPRRPFRCRT